MNHVQPGEVKLVLCGHRIAPELHASVTSENQFHCTRLYVFRAAFFAGLEALAVLCSFYWERSHDRSAESFLSSFGEFAWFPNVGGMHFEDTEMKAHKMHRNAACFEPPSKLIFNVVHVRGSCTWFKTEPGYSYSSVVRGNVLHGEPRIAKTSPLSVPVSLDLNAG